MLKIILRYFNICIIQIYLLNVSKFSKIYYFKIAFFILLIFELQLSKLHKNKMAVE